MKLRYAVKPGLEPKYGNDRAAGVDIRAAEVETFLPGEVRPVATTLHVEIPPGHVGLLRGRSSLAFKKDLWAFEGTIDEDYRGPVALLFRNMGKQPAMIEEGERVAQLVIVPVVRLALENVLYPENLSPTERGANGIGSTGKR